MRPSFPVLHHSLWVQLRNCYLPEDVIWVWEEWHRRKWKIQESFHTDAKDPGRTQGCWEWPRRSSDAQVDSSYKRAQRWHWLDTFGMWIPLLPQYPTVPQSSTSTDSYSSSLGESSCLTPCFIQLWGAHLSAHHLQLYPSVICWGGVEAAAPLGFSLTSLYWASLLSSISQLS